MHTSPHTRAASCQATSTEAGANLTDCVELLMLIIVTEKRQAGDCTFELIYDLPGGGSFIININSLSKKNGQRVDSHWFFIRNAI